MLLEPLPGRRGSHTQGEGGRMAGAEHTGTHTAWAGARAHLVRLECSKPLRVRVSPGHSHSRAYLEFPQPKAELAEDRSQHMGWHRDRGVRSRGRESPARPGTFPAVRERRNRRRETGVE